MSYMSIDKFCRSGACQTALPFVLMASILFGFLDRPALFHDEIINTSKADMGTVFDYAIRPLFFFLNYLAVNFFGNHPLSLSLMLVVFFGIGGWYTFLYLRRDFGFLAGLAGVATYAWLGWMYPLGISGMAHILPPVFVVCALYYYHSAKAIELPLGRKVLISVLLWSALMTHPTAVALLLAFYLMIGLSLTGELITGKISTSRWAGEISIWAIIVVGMLLATEAIFYTATSGAVTYIGSWMDGLVKTSSDKFSRYFEPYDYYFDAIRVQFFPVLVLTALAVIGYAWSKVGRDGPSSRTGWLAGLTDSTIFDLLVLSVVALCIISAEKWKFDRVLVSFAPLVSLFLVAVVFACLSHLRKHRLTLGLIFAVLIVGSSLHNFMSQVDQTEKRLERKRFVYSNFFEEVRTLGGGPVAYLGRKSEIRIARNAVSAADRVLNHVAWPTRTSESYATFFLGMMDHGYRHVILDLRDDSGYVLRFREEMKELGMQRKAVYFSGNYELWDLTPVFLGSEVEASLNRLARMARVAIAPGRSGSWLKWALADKGLAVATLKTSSGSHAIASHLESEDIRAVIIADGASPKMRSVKTLLDERGYARTATGSVFPTDKGTLEVWMKQEQ